MPAIEAKKNICVIHCTSKQTSKQRHLNLAGKNSSLQRYICLAQSVQTGHTISLESPNLRSHRPTASETSPIC